MKVAYQCYIITTCSITFTPITLKWVLEADHLRLLCVPVCMRALQIYSTPLSLWLKKIYLYQPCWYTHTEQFIWLCS